MKSILLRARRRFRMGVIWCFIALAWTLSGTRGGLAGETPMVSQRELTFGPEFEFGAPWLRHYPNPLEFLKTRYIHPDHHEQKAIEKFLAVVERKCKTAPCKTERIPGKYDETGAFTYRVTFPDGWFFDITPDAWVVEITAQPQTLKGLRQRQKLMDDFIFASAREIGLDPQATPFFGLFGKAAGHVNFGTLTAFGDSGRSWLRYFVDYANQPELAFGALQKDMINAPPFSALKDEQKQALQVLVDQINQGGDRPVGPLASRVAQEVYTHTPVIGVEPWHYQAMGIKHVGKLQPGSDSDKPTEHRAMPSQDNAGQFIKIAELIQARVAFLEAKTSEPILFLPSNQTHFSDRELVSRFYVYVEEMGLNFQDYKELLRPNLRNVKPDSFLIESHWNYLSYEDAVKHLPHLATSAYLRDKFVRYLKSEAGRLNAADLLEHVYVKTRDATLNPQLRAAYLRFLIQVKANRPYQQLVLDESLQPLLRQADRDLQPASVKACAAVFQIR